MNSIPQFDVAIIGGGPAGLSAALILGRAVRSVVVFDHGEPRNTPARMAQSVFTRDGTPPRELIETARHQLGPYGVTIWDVEITDLQHHSVGFELISSSGSEAVARKVILGTGLVDVMPEITGIDEFWGKSVVHCPYCHGWELRNQPIAALVNKKSVLSFASLLRGWSEDLVLLSNGPLHIDDEIRDLIRAHELNLVETEIEELAGTEGKLEKVVFRNGESIDRSALFIDPQQKLRSDLYQNLELDFNDDGNIKTNRFGETSISGVYVAGDAGPNMQQITIAAATGAEVAIGVNHKLSKEDFEKMGHQPEQKL